MELPKTYREDIPPPMNEVPKKLKEMKVEYTGPTAKQERMAHSEQKQAELLKALGLQEEKGMNAARDTIKTSTAEPQRPYKPKVESARREDAPPTATWRDKLAFWKRGDN